MPISKENRPTFERLRDQYDINFIDELPRAEWPVNHQSLFETIETFKEFKYSTYAASPEDLNERPWRAEAKRQARKLVEKARDCAARNEDTWRHACEPIVFNRLAAEIACKSCRKRVWRSEIETALNDNDKGADYLKKRQAKRDPCRCSSNTGPDDEDEKVGLNKLFIDRANEPVIHPPILAEKLPQVQKPDRIYGLRKTRRIEDCLLAKLSNGQFLEENLGNQPYLNTGEPLLFPFLVVEAKASQAADDWPSIRLQTAFPIYTYLQTQQDLRLRAGARSQWTPEPLVWFFMSRGDDWRLCLAYQTPPLSRTRIKSSSYTTNIVQVWTGCIANRSDSLQLLLIVDYMSDWARDYYRKVVLDELRILAFPTSASLSPFADTEIFSSGGTDSPSSIPDLELFCYGRSNRFRQRFQRPSSDSLRPAVAKDLDRTGLERRPMPSESGIIPLTLENRIPFRN